MNSINNWPIFVQAQCLRMVLLAVGRLIQCMWVTEWKDPLTICTLFGPFLIYQFLFHVLGGAKVTWNYSISSEGCFWNYSRGSGFFFQLTLGSDRLRFFLFFPLLILCLSGLQYFRHLGGSSFFVFHTWKFTMRSVPLYFFLANYYFLTLVYL